MSDGGSQRAFETTHWSLVQAAAERNYADGRKAMQQLCQRYWFPLYAFARREGHGTEDAQDLIQGFFVRILEKDVLRHADRDRGRFRNFLLRSLQHFMSNEAAKAAAICRGGGHGVISLDFRDAEGRLAHEAVDRLSPEAHYHRHWALEVLQRCFERLRAEYAVEGHADLFAALQPYLSADSQRLPYAAVAPRLGMNADAVKVAVHRLRRRYRRTLEREIVETVSTPEEVDEEIQELFRALGGSTPPG